jgi:polyisoprenoid-binding protein YceI
LTSRPAISIVSDLLPEGLKQIRPLALTIPQEKSAKDNSMKKMTPLSMVILSMILAGSSLLANQAPPNAPSVKKPSSSSAPKPSAKPQSKVSSYSMDVPGSKIGFVVKTRLMTIDAVFSSWTGKLSMDSTKLNTLSLTLNVDSTSIDTGSGLKNDEIKGKNFFDVEKFPKIKLISNKATAAGPGQCQVQANFTLRGITKSVTIPLTVQLDGNGQGTVKGEYSIDRKDYGITHNMFLNPIEDTVVISLDLKIQGKTSAARTGSQSPSKP